MAGSPAAAGTTRRTITTRAAPKDLATAAPANTARRSPARPETPVGAILEGVSVCSKQGIPSRGFRRDMRAILVISALLVAGCAGTEEKHSGAGPEPGIE